MEHRTSFGVTVTVLIICVIYISLKFNANNGYYLNENIPVSIRTLVVSERTEMFETASNPDIELFSAYLTPYKEEEDNNLVSVLENHSAGNEAISEISSINAIKDVTFLIDYLKYFYGGYGYFGGDNVFFSIRDEVIKELESMEDPIKTADYEQLLKVKLKPVINDKHFSIGSASDFSVDSLSVMLVNEDYTFTKKDKTFVTNDGKYEYVSAVSDSGREANLIPYIDDTGSFTYVIGALNDTGDSVSITLNLKNIATGEIDKTETELNAISEYSAQSGNVFYNVGERDGVKIALSRSFYANNQQAESRFDYMLEAGKDLRGEKVIVFDLRQNGGGNSRYGEMWLQGFLGLNNQIQGARAEIRSTRFTKTVAYVSPYSGFSSVSEFENYIEEEERGFRHFPGWRDISAGSPAKYDNKDTLVLVLTDRGTGSSAENFVKLLKQVENTVIIGTNTSGAYSFGNVTEIQLPYSNITLNCGHNLTLEADVSSIESAGITPDIWAPAGDGLDRVLKFIDKYGLK